MFKSFTFKTLALLLVLLGGGNLVAMAQNDYSDDFTGNVVLSTEGGTSASACSVIIDGASYDGVKAGTGKIAGAMVISVPSGTKYLHMHVSAWNNETVTLAVTPSGYSEDIALTANSGISNNSPFTFNGDATSDDYYKVITFSEALESEVSLTFTATTGKRFVVWGVTAEIEGGVVDPSVATSITIDDSGITNTNVFEGTAAGKLTATVTAGGTAISGATVTWSSSDEGVATIAADGNVTLVAAGETTITAAYAGVEGQYKPSNRTYKLTVTNVNPDAVMTITAVREQGEGAVVTKGVVTSVNGKTAYIQDEEAAIVVYGSSNLTVAVGDEISVSGTLTTYNGLLEIGSPTYEVLSSGNIIQPEVMTIAEINSTTKQAWLIKIEEATVNAINGQNVTIAQGENTVVVRFNKTSDITFAVNDIVTLTGNIGCFNGVQIANPTDIEVQQSTEPSVTPAKTAYGIGSEGGDVVVNVTYANCFNSGIDFVNAEGTSIGDWPEGIENWDKDDAGNITLTIGENTGEERKFYVVIVATKNSANVQIRSEVITITQDAYVEPAEEFATLPFEFNGGKADIEGTDGLTQEGLNNTDYKTDNTKLKFDGTGDWLLLSFDEEPDVLYFDIKSNKGNTPWDGTFTVLTSEDGEEFTELAEYTPDNLDPNDFQTECFVLDRDVRYVKWIYTEKVSGNVGVGNIHLFEPDAFIEVPVTAAGWATYVTPFALMFNADQAFVVTSASKTSVKLEHKGMVCSGTPLLIKGTKGEETTLSVYVGNNMEFYAPETNLLKASNGSVKGDGSTIYALAEVEGKVGFYRVKKDSVIDAGKCYLKIEEENADGARDFLSLDDEATGINDVLVNGENGEVYDLQGRRVEKPVKGLYIQNGKKVVVK